MPGIDRPLARIVAALAALLLGPCPLQAQAECAQQQLQSHRVHFCLYGEGGPTILLAAGAGQDSRTWNGLAQELSEFGTVLTFDRAGLGRSSDAADRHRSPRKIAAEVRELIDLLDVPTPLLLIGHSAGGWHVLRLAELLPDEVSGLVLVDTPPPNFEARRNQLLSEEEREARQEQLARGAASAPQVVRDERSAARPDVDSGFPPLPDHVSLVVVAANGQEFGSGRHEAALRDRWLELSRRWLDLTRVGRFIVADDSGHMVHQERPELIVDLVRSLVPS